MTDINLDGLSVEQLEVLKGDIDKAVEGKKTSELLEVRAKLDELIDNSPFTLEEVLEAQKMRKPVEPKYRNPNDANQTWTGRGRKPLWVVEHLENGGSLEEVLI